MADTEQHHMRSGMDDQRFLNSYHNASTPPGDGELRPGIRARDFHRCERPPREGRCAVTQAGRSPHDQAHAGAVGTRHRQRQLEVPFLHEVGVRPTSARFNGTLHGFLMLNPICGAAALKQTIHVLRKAPGTS